TVERAGQDACTRRLAAAARSGKQIGVMHATGSERLPQRFGDVLLADDFSERRRAVLAIQREAHRTPVPFSRHGACRFPFSRHGACRSVQPARSLPFRSAGTEPALYRTPRTPARARSPL